MKKSLHTLNKELHGEKAGNYLAALVDNRLKSLDYILYNPHQVAFVDYSHPDGRRTYIRSLSFLLQKAVREVFPQAHLRISYSVENALYCDLEFPDNREVTPEDMAKSRGRHEGSGPEKSSLQREKVPTEEAQRIFLENGFPQKALLQKQEGILCICLLPGKHVRYVLRTARSFYRLSYILQSLPFPHRFLLQYPSPTIRSG